jgi:hypothetical protein
VYIPTPHKSERWPYPAAQSTLFEKARCLRKHAV